MGHNRSDVIFGVVVLLVLISAIIFFSFYYKLLPDDIFTKKKPVEEFKEFYDMRVICPVGAEFDVKYKNLDLISGEMNENSIEKIGDLIMGREYVLSCWDDDDVDIDYYKGYVTCVNQTVCELELEKQGVISTEIKRYLNNIDYEIHIREGTIKDPVLCIAWVGMYNVEVGLVTHPIIPRLINFVDACFYVRDIPSVQIIYIEIPEVDSSIKFFIIDKCLGDYGDCGIEDYIENIKI